LVRAQVNGPECFRLPQHGAAFLAHLKASGESGRNRRSDGQAIAKLGRKELPEDFPVRRVANQAAQAFQGFLHGIKRPGFDMQSGGDQAPPVFAIGA